MKNSIRAFSLSLLPLAVFMATTGTASAAGYSDARNSAMGGTGVASSQYGAAALNGGGGVCGERGGKESRRLTLIKRIPG
ncbi:hypothetical protein FPE53_24190 [Salmonella enterica subsp. enterica]|uniref:Uncharacterized protein n=2 Tax=Salmonella enterica TaxID=28901 RepID=A0A744QID2_SALER|nr:hypothetical protein [Salmonella enterica subsp. enterica serovar Aqua]ECH1172289.1 hypothetical protein [Salmonella enterica subsp. enterica serovar Aqua]HAF2609381.1 hypothetical protein [Salmonella enterica]